MSQKLIDAIDAILPQTQCRECSYAGCRPYADAMVNEGERINRCPPGGVKVLHQLADLLHQDATPYLQEVAENTRGPATAVIREDECIGCTKCIQACPVDAIIGTAKHMHVILGDECTGCELCVEPCPVDCIDIVSLAEPAYAPDQARQRFEARQKRLLQQAAEKKRRHDKARKLEVKPTSDAQAKQDYIKAALARVSAKKSSNDHE